jgi:hypothetical protein
MQSQWKALIALLLFFVVGFLLACPLLTVGGEAGGYCKMAVFLLLFFRLAWCMYKRKFRFRDYFIYLAIVIVVCIAVDYQF